jgi:hypothetical protein
MLAHAPCEACVIRRRCHRLGTHCREVTVRVVEEAMARQREPSGQAESSMQANVQIRRAPVWPRPQASGLRPLQRMCHADPPLFHGCAGTIEWGAPARSSTGAPERGLDALLPKAEQRKFLPNRFLPEGRAT